MKAESSIYIKLQNIYKDKARKDANEVLTAVRSIAGGNDVDLAEVEMFCTNARFIKLINSTPDDAVDLNKVVGKCHRKALGRLGALQESFPGMLYPLLLLLKVFPS